MRIEVEKKDEHPYQNFVFTIVSGAASYSSKKQSSITLSSMESEYIALLHALKEQICILRFLKEINYNIDD